MGRDIHWVIERRHPGGDWHAVAAKTEIAIAAMSSPSWPRGVDFSAPERQIGMRDYVVFHLLSAAQFDDDEDGVQIATPWLPGDVGAYAASDLAPGGDIHSQGYVLLADLEEAVSGAVHPVITALADEIAAEEPDETASAQRIAARLSARLDAILQTAENPKIAGSILHPRDETGKEITPSAHRRLDMKQTFDELEPVRGESLRLVIGYDN